jgi:hypothetical protein
VTVVTVATIVVSWSQVTLGKPCEKTKKKPGLIAQAGLHLVFDLNVAF